MMSRKTLEFAAPFDDDGKWHQGSAANIVDCEKSRGHSALIVGMNAAIASKASWKLAPQNPANALSFSPNND